MPQLLNQQSQLQQLKELLPLRTKRLNQPRNKLHHQRLKRKNQQPLSPNTMMKSMMTKGTANSQATWRKVMMDTIQNQMSKLLRNSQWNIRLKPLLQQPRRTQNKSSLNNSKRSKAKHPSYQSRENKQLQKPSFWNRLSKKAALAQSLTGHRLSQTKLPMLVAKWLLPTR